MLLTKKIFVFLAVSMIGICNADDDPIAAIELLEAILNETRLARYEFLERSIVQESALNDLINKLETTNRKLDRVTNKLGRNLMNVSNELHGVRQEAQDYYMQFKQWYTQPRVFVSFSSCQEIRAMSPSAPSGYYNITQYDGTEVLTYCEYHDVCGSSGWTKVAYLDMSDPSQQCPSEFRLYEQSGVRACGRQASAVGSCDSVTFSTNNIHYSQVCGRVIGYQFGQPDAITSNTNFGLDTYYVDGVSITHGSPRKHIWTFAAADKDTGTSYNDCYCNDGNNINVRSFVGMDYFCESGNSAAFASTTLYVDDPLWDGEGCGGDEGPCCAAPGIPWFRKQLDSPSADDIELRICSNIRTTVEDTPVSLYEIYVK